MSTKLEILSQVMLSLKSKQTKIMHNINVLINSNDMLDLHDKIEFELGTLANIHAKMQECESFMIQIASSSIAELEKTENKEKKEEE